MAKWNPRSRAFRRHRPGRRSLAFETLENYLLLAAPPTPIVYQADGANYSPRAAQELSLPPPFQLSPELAIQDVQVEGGRTHYDINPVDGESHTGYYKVPVHAGDRVAVEFTAFDPSANLEGWQIGTYWGMEGSVEQNDVGIVTDGNLISLIALRDPTPGQYSSDSSFIAPSNGNAIIFTNQFYYQNTPDQGTIRSFFFQYDFTYSYDIIVSSSPPTTTPTPASTVSLTYMDWNGSAYMKVLAPNLEMERGIDFRYTVAGNIDPNLPIPIAFYWATGDDPLNVQSDGLIPAQAYGDDEADEFIINNATGKHGYLTGEDPSAGNVTARWGVPPAGAKYVVAIVDPLNLLGEEDYSGRVRSLALPVSVESVLNNSIKTPIVRGGNIDARFRPGSGTGKDIPLSEAEVYLGIDHFNWIQEITRFPSTWTRLTFKNLDFDRVRAARKYDPDGVAYVNSDMYYYNSDGSIDLSAPITHDVDGNSTWYDPIVQPSAADVPNTYTRGILVHNGKGISVHFFPIDSDEFQYYYDEAKIDSGHSSWPDLGPKTEASYLMFHDAPISSAYGSPYEHGNYEYFQTQLVGVGYDPSTAVRYAALGYNVFFLWKDNSLRDPMSGGVQLAKNNAYISDSDIGSGGIFDVKVGDPKDYIREIQVRFEDVPPESLYLGQSATRILHAGSAIPGAVFQYSLDPSSPSGAAIDRDTGHFVFNPPSVGVFTITAKVVDQRGNSASTMFHITVLPNPSSPVVKAGPDSAAIARVAFSHSVSFQDANNSGILSSTVSYGDGSPLQSFVVTSDHKLNLSHTFLAVGSYTVTVTVTNSLGLSGSDRFTVVVTQPSSGVGSVPDAFVAVLYRGILGRDPEPSGLLFWARRFVTHHHRAEIVKALFISAERQLLVKYHLAAKITPRFALNAARRAVQSLERPS